jgi:hypothetical protein
MPRTQFELDIVCPSCDRAGKARASDDDIPNHQDPAFRVESYPEGFSEAKRSVYLTETLVRCECGQEFYLL